MAQRDWEEVYKKLNSVDEMFITSLFEDIFFPSQNQKNPFEDSATNLSATHLKKDKPGQWIPIYKKEDLPRFFLENNIMPVRAGPAEFFFYYGNIFYDLSTTDFVEIDTQEIIPIESFVPSTLKADFQRNENAFLNKAVALGYINHFLETIDPMKVFEHEIETKHRKRLLYGQFGKIKMTKDLLFKTAKGNKTIRSGFLFEIDLVLESEDEIIIFEAKSSKNGVQSFSLLQLYYPLIYLQSILTDTEKEKKIRTIFIDIVSDATTELYRLVEFEFKNNFFDRWEVVKSFSYAHSTLK